MELFRKLWADDAGFIISAELCLVATIVVIGLIVGLCTLRNQIVQELADVGEAIGSVNTSFVICGVKGNDHGTGCCGCWTGASSWIDFIHFCHPMPWEQGPGRWVGGIQCVAPDGCYGQSGSTGQVGS